MTVTVSGTRTQSPQGPSTISSPSSGVVISTTNTNITGNLNVAGYEVVGGDLTVFGASTLTQHVRILSTDVSTSTQTGALVVDGGVGIGDSINVFNSATVGTTLFVGSDTTIKGGAFIGTYLQVGTTATEGVTTASIYGPTTIYNSATITGTITVVGNSSTVIIKSNDDNVGNPLGVAYTNTNVYDTFADRVKGAVYVAGGVGIEKDLNVGGFIYGRVATANTTVNVVVTTTNADQVFYPMFADFTGVGVTSTGYTSNYIDDVSSGTTTSTGGLTYVPYTGLLTSDQMAVAAEYNSTSTNTGAFTVAGGAGIAQDVHIGGAAYAEAVYTNLLASTFGNIAIEPKGGETDIYGEIRVRGGTKPIGTAPVVTNVLYVTMDGDDTNDGRAMDPSRACRTVGGAMKSPYYQPGTQIRVSPGHYFENNPLVMKPYTSVMGSDIRTTELEPINKTQDLFHVNSGCYLAFMQFCQGRSGLLPGNYYANGYNRGAYATAFPPQTGNNRIDLFHSPYIQNCTNLSGPWLKDGNLFQPDGTVQVPIAVGKSTWSAGTSTLTVTLDTNVSTGTITQGMSITQGQQNPGFFNARTLLLSNKAFMQAQVVSYIDQQFNSGAFTYRTTSCYRDVGFIVDAIAQDMVYNGTSDSTFAGLQYYSQNGGYTGAIGDEINTTTSAINWFSTFTFAIADALDPSQNSADTLSNLFNVINGILIDTPNNYNTTGVTNNIVPNDLPSSNTTTVAIYNALLAAIPTIALETVNYITSPSGLNFTNFNTATCYRDVGYIIESVAFDFLHGGNLQSIKAGTYYFGYDNTSSVIPNEGPQVTAAYNYIKSLIPNIVTGQKLPSQYSTGTQIITGYNPGTSHEVATLQANIDVITNIIRNGPNAAATKVPMGSVESGNIEVINAYNILEANRAFIQEEVVAYVNSQFSNFTYNREICYRDVGILVENVAYDATFGGNQKSVEAGLSYWNGVTSVISGEITQTVSAVDYLNQLCQKVILNEPCPVLPAIPGSGISTSSQVINTVMVDGGVVSESIASLFGIITNIMENGPDVAPTSYNSAAIDAAYLSAEVLLQANRQFIQEDTINWINNTFVQFPYNKIKCERDVGIIINSVIGDVLFPTPGYSQSTFAGLEYWNQGTQVGLIPQEINQTIDAVTYLRDLSVKIIQNITPADDLVARYQSTVTQVTSLQAATSSEAANITANYDNILSILGGNTKGWTDKLVFGWTPSTYTSVQNAYALLQANIPYMQAEVVAYINAVNPGFSGTYNATTCQRDIGYIVDCISFDLLHNSNKQSIQAGLSYYGFTAGSSAIANETTQTVAAFNYLSTITGLVIQNIPVQGYSAATQVTNLPTPTNTSATIALFTQAYNTITNIIANGPGVAVDVSPISLTMASSTDVADAVAILQANIGYLTSEVVAYIDASFNATNYTYNTATCSRDAGLIIDSIAQDMLYDSISDSTFAGLQYWTQTGLTGLIAGELTTTTSAINYVKTQVVNALTDSTAISTVNRLFGNIVSILQNGPDAFGGTGVTNNFQANGLPSNTSTIVSSYETMIGLLPGLQLQTVNWINSTNPGFSYNTATCYRDVGYIVESVAYDLLTGGNKQSLKAGTYYYSYSTTSSQVYTELPEVTAAYNFIADRVRYVVLGQPVPQLFQTTVPQVTNMTVGTDDEVATLQANLNVIIDIINNGPNVAGPKIPMPQTIDGNQNVFNAYEILKANRAFIQAEIIAFINQTFTGTKSFSYNESLCYRDTGLIVDAVSQDTLLGGNQKSVEAGLAYWNQAYNYVTGQETTTTMAINHARDIALKIIANEVVTPQPQTETKQIINTFYSYGGNYMPKQSVARSFNIVTDIIERGPVYAPIIYPGSGLTNVTGLNALDIQIAPTVTSVDQVGTYTYLVGMSTTTVGFAYNGTLYFGKTSIFPLQDSQVEEIALQYTGSTSTWDLRKVDPIGGMGGSLVDGAVISDRSPIQSFVYDAFTQLTQGGRGVRVTNDGYAQLVSVFTIFSSVGVQVDNGGIASIVNSNANFGDQCLVAKGYGLRKFSGTVYNPAFHAYPDSPGPTGLNQYYPNGFWPNNGNVEIFVPDTSNRPHISLVMEVVPPDTYIDYTGSLVPYTNDQGLPGFLNAQPSIGTITSGTITITGLDVTGIAVGNFVYIEDQFGYRYDNIPFVHDEFGRYLDASGYVTTTSSNYIPNPNYLQYYCQTGTYVTDVNYESVTLNYAIPVSAGYSDNPNYFTIYFCGNAYYTVLSSTIANNPRVTGTNILSVNNSNISVDQVQAHIDSIEFLNELVDNVIGNTPVKSIQTATNASTQTFIPSVTGGQNAREFIDLRFGNMTKVIGATDATYQNVANAQVIKQTGTVPSGAGSAVTMIEANKKFLQDEVAAFVNTIIATSSTTFTYDQTKCSRDLGYILQGTYYDVALGTNYNAVTSGLAYTRGVSANVVNDELVPTLEAFDYAQQQAALALSTSAVAVARNTAEFVEIRNILSNGAAVASVITYPAPSNATQATINSVAQLTANKAFLQAEIIAWLAINFPAVTFNAGTCARDVGYLIDAICYDVMYGGNSASIICANAYFDASGNILIGSGEYSATYAAYNHLITLANDVVLGTTITPSAGNTMSQSQNGNYGTSSQTAVITANLGIVATAINTQSLGAVPGTVYPAITWADSGVQAAVTQLANQQSTIIDNTIKYINETLGSPFSYNTATCYRDTGLIVDALAQDLLFGGTSQSTFAAIQYWNQSGHVGAVGDELTTTTNTINYISSLAQKIVQNDTSGTRYQNTVTQNTSLTPGTITQIEVLQANISTITNIITNGPSVAPAKTPLSVTMTSNTTTIAAAAIVHANRAFIQAEVVGYVDAVSSSTFSYSESKCYRDTGLVVDAIVQDMLFGGTSQSVFAGLQYWNQDLGYTGAIGNEITTTTAAISYVKSLAQLIVANNTGGTRYQNTVTQNTSLPAATVNEQTLIAADFDVILNILNNGTTGITDTIVPNGITQSGTASVQHAYALLQANRAYIQAEALAYVMSTGFTQFNGATCYRDVGYMIDSVSVDLLYGGNRQAVQSGVYYYSYDANSTRVPNEMPETTAAYRYISTLVNSIVRAEQVTTTYQTNVAQVTSLPAATGAEATTIATDFAVITHILTTGTAGVTDLIVPNGLTASSDSNVQNAFNLLQANKAYLQAEAIAYVTANATSGFVYSPQTCARDVGYMVDSVSVDLLYGGNRQAIQSGVYYWNYEADSSAIAGEIPQTTQAYNHIRSIVSNIIQSIPLTTTYQNAVSQVTSASKGTSAEVAIVQSEVDIITTIINNGPGGVVKTPIGVTPSTSASVVNAAALLHANRAFIQAEVIAYINQTYQSGKISLTQSQALKCKRDVGIILDALVYDLQSGGNYNSVYSGLSYWSRDGTHHIVSLGENVTNSALFPDGAVVNFYQRSYISASGYVFEYVGAGTNYGALPQFGIADPVQTKETVQLDSGKVFFTSTDQNGDFRIGPGLVISQATGVLSGRTFTKSLFANLTPFILAIEGGGTF